MIKMIIYSQTVVNVINSLKTVNSVWIFDFALSCRGAVG